MTGPFDITFSLDRDGDPEAIGRGDESGELALLLTWSNDPDDIDRVITTVDAVIDGARPSWSWGCNDTRMDIDPSGFRIVVLYEPPPRTTLCEGDLRSLRCLLVRWRAFIGRLPPA